MGAYGAAMWKFQFDSPHFRLDLAFSLGLRPIGLFGLQRYVWSKT